AREIVRLVEAGYLDRILLSNDVFLKMMLTHYGGNGYAYILRHFIPRLERHGLDTTVLDEMMRGNTRRVFDDRA
ncbi:phosphotriesterase-related protein, partial [Rhizobium leguminosarum]